MAEYCLECFLKQNPDYPPEKIRIGSPDDLDLCEGCGQMKPTVCIKIGFWQRIRNIFRK